MTGLPSLLVTGSAGGLGRELVPRLRAAGHRVRCLDLQHPGGAGADAVAGSVTDPRAVETALEGVDAVVHLGGISREAAWADVLETNVHGTWVLLDACARLGVGKVVFASSNHAVGLTPRLADGAHVPADAEPRPDSYYGWSKTAGESLCRLFAERAGLDVVSVRIGSCFERPGDVRGLATWMSYDDCRRLVSAAVDPAVTGWHSVWGISRNTRRWWSLAEGEAIGYHPQDDSERFAAQVLAAADPDEVTDLVGGPFTANPLGRPN
ncbi:NAD-dependent epimerase/dehydratase family protein [Kineococcus sp. SYSU DK002]|uniref:NAD-dependent epimerase/dehydratase family protein n=1 Tax=Kineococcus sp. SYSU DK002 TaxID=3383123 RepID=UPI003D7D4C6C